MNRSRRRRLTPTPILVGLVLLAASAGTVPLAAQPDTGAPKRMTAYRINPTPPRIDGHLDDAVWRRAEFTGDFRQKQPDEGVPAANRTEVAIAYDAHALYVAARLHCVSPDQIMATVARRDRVTNDERIIVSLDTYHNSRTAYSFAVTAAGVRADYYHRSDSEYDRDYGFDPVWEARVTRTHEGWSAEMRIPFTQLRFNNTDEQVWGVNWNRWVPNKNEDSYWIVVPKDAQGWSSRMGELVGISGIKQTRRIELIPYAASDLTVASKVNADDPFAEKTDYQGRLGGDFRMGVGPNLTLEGTINPDFGQVEADPAEVNLSAFETFFSERRPFFTEGRDLLTGGGSNYFYSRRIGARPSGVPQRADGTEADFVDRPDNTSILGAAKLTGRLGSGLSIGALTALTQEEEAEGFFEDTGERVTNVVEPATAYGVLRLQQEFGKNASTAGIVLTGVRRDLDPAAPINDELRRRAVAGGADWNLRFHGGDYTVNGSVGFSDVYGSPAAIAATQTSSARYFQRPDADYVDFDPLRESLTGWVARSTVQKRAGRWRWGVGGDAESPEFEINDAGQLNTADDITSYSWLGYVQTEPGDVIQDWNVYYNMGAGWNFGRDRQYTYFNIGPNITWKNFYGNWFFLQYNAPAQSDSRTRGGPSMGYTGEWNWGFGMWSNPQRKVLWNWNYNGAANQSGWWYYNVGGGVTYKPGQRWEIQVGPSWTQSVNGRQYVDEIASAGGGGRTFGARYVFGDIERSTLVAQTRLNYAFTPDLTLELYAEPFAASGRYSNFGELEAARSQNLRRYGENGTEIERDPNGDNPSLYRVTDGADTFEFEATDFNFVSFRQNVVLRWEFSPGSTLYVVWQQNRSDFEEDGSLVGPSSFGDAFTAPGDNFVAVKVAYWIPLL